MKILAIRRAACFSPNNVAKDAAILDGVVQCLVTGGHQVLTADEDDLAAMPLAEMQTCDVVLHMGRRMATLMQLERLAALTPHPRIVNAAHAVRTVAKSRELTLSLLHEGGVAVPPWWAYEPEEDEMFQCEEHLQALLPGWVKAMRGGGAQPGDVQYVETPLQADAAVMTLAAEAVPDIVVTRHLDGDLLKCYVVAPDGQTMPWLHAFYPQETGYSKFGRAELHNTPLAHIAYDAGALRQMACRIAACLGLQVFGFDAVVSADGTLTVIDVNDWPSFAVCRDEAACRIAELVGSGNN